MNSRGAVVLGVQRGYRVLATADQVLAIDPQQVPAGAYTLREHAPAGTPFRDLMTWWRAVQPGRTAPWEERAMNPQEIAGIIDRACAAAAAGTPRAAQTMTAADAVLRDDALWEYRREVGYRVDASPARSLLQRREQERGEWADRLGIDLTRRTHATVDWLIARGVPAELEEKKGYSRVVVPRGLDLAPLVVAYPELAHWPVVKSIGDDLATLGPLVRAITRAGRVYPTIDVNGAASGRMRSMAPNLQGTRRDLRRLLLADPGMALVTADHSSAELFIAAAIIGDPALTRLVEDGKVYDIVAQRAGVERKVAKISTLAWLYGQGAKGLTRTVGDPAVAARITTAVQQLPSLHEWATAQREAAARGERQRTLYGRPLPALPADEAYKASNRIIQGSARDAYGLAVEAVAADLGAEALWLPLHDEIVVQVPTSTERDALATLREQFSIVLPGGLRIRTEPEILGRSWAPASTK